MWYRVPTTGQKLQVQGYWVGHIAFSRALWGTNWFVGAGKWFLNLPRFCLNGTFYTILISAAYMQWWPLAKVTILISQLCVLTHLKNLFFYNLGWTISSSTLEMYSPTKKLYSCAHVKYFWCLPFVYIDLLKAEDCDIFPKFVKNTKDTIWISWSALLRALWHNRPWILYSCTLPVSTVCLHLHDAVLLPIKCKH